MSNDIIPYSDIEKMGKAVAESSLFGIKTQQQAIALMLVEQALGKHPALAAMEYNIIQGRPAKKADAMQIDFQSSGGKIEWHELTDLKAEATFSHPQSSPLRLDWTIERAKKAGLYDKEGSMYKKYPRQMLRARLVADGVRAVYPAATGGMLSKEEAEDITEVTVDISKSKVEKIVNQVEEAQIVKAEPKAEVKNEPKKEAIQPKTSNKDTGHDAGLGNKDGVQGVQTEVQETLPEGHHKIQVIIDSFKCLEIGDEKKPKWVFVAGDMKLGTFDANLSEQIVKVVGKNILSNIEYKERETKPGLFVKDIISFSQVTMNEVLI